MFTHIPAVGSAIARNRLSAIPSALRGVAVIITLGVLAGCTVPTAPFAAADPSNPHASVRGARYAPVTAGYTAQRPVGPRPWRELNDSVAP